MNKVKILNRDFQISISSNQIFLAIEKIASKMNEDLNKKDVIFFGILNGAFMFASDLLKRIDFDCQISFLKLVSYQGYSNSGCVNRLIGVNEDIKNKTVVILEDIIDTGATLDYTIKQLKGYEPKEVKVAALLFKPGSYSKKIEIDYTGFEISNHFVIGYGLDYKGFGRNLPDIYKIIK